MKSDMHPEYRFVVFRDVATNFQFLGRSTLDLSRYRETTTVDGEEYPVVSMDVTADSHPFYTGQQKLMDTEGRVEAYYRKYGFKAPEEPGDDTGASTAEASETE